jgi:molecular chaperone DnaJ
MAIDPYEALGVSKDASQDDIKKAYRKLARQYHPDVHPGDKEAENKFKEISEAYDILGDPDKRAEYDRLGQQGFYNDAFGGQGYQRPDFEGGFNFEDLFGDLFGRRGGARTSTAGGMGGMGGQPGGFDFFFGGPGGGPGAGRGFRTGPQRGGDLTYKLKVGFREALQGTETMLSFDRPQPCASCGGAGFDPNSGQPCPSCGGRGQTTTHESIKAKIPAGVDTGQKVRLAGKGQPGVNGGPAGDLLLEIDVAPDPVFTRKGRDLYVETNVTLFEAVLGGKIEVPTLSGRASLKVPAGTQNGAKMRLKGQGAPETKNKPAGDLYVTVKVLVPKELDEQAKAKFEELQQMVPMDPQRR